MNLQRRNFLRTSLLIPAAAIASSAVPPIASAHGGADASTASSLSLSLPIAVLVAAPVAFLSAGAVLTVVAIEVLAEATVWTVRRASDGARASLHFSGDVLTGSALAIGSVIAVTVVSAGWLLSVAGEVICLVPNALGEALLYNERVR